MKKNQIPSLPYRRAKGVIVKMAEDFAKDFQLGYSKHDKDKKIYRWFSGETEAVSARYVAVVAVKNVIILEVSTDSSQWMKLMLTETPHGEMEFYGITAIGERGYKWAQLAYKTYARRANDAWMEAEKERRREEQGAEGQEAEA